MSDKNVKTTEYRDIENQTAKNRIVVMGLGNLLLQDEGIGVHIVRRLKKLDLPENVTVIEAGTATLDTLLIHDKITTLIVIDAARTGHKSGTIYKAAFKAAEINKLAENLSNNSQLSLHQLGLAQALDIAKKIGRAPEQIRIIVVEPEKIDYSLELTEILKQKIPEIIETVLGEIKNAVHAE